MLQICWLRRPSSGNGAGVCVLPRRDVKSLAKSLIAKFGSFAEVILPLCALQRHHALQP
jgi:hypothetical protein